MAAVFLIALELVGTGAATATIKNSGPWKHARVPVRGKSPIADFHERNPRPKLKIASKLLANT